MLVGLPLHQSCQWQVIRLFNLIFHPCRKKWACWPYCWLFIWLSLFCLFSPSFCSTYLWMCVTGATVVCGLCVAVCSFCSPYGFRGRYTQRRCAQDKRFKSEKNRLSYHNAGWFGVNENGKYWRKVVLSSMVPVNDICVLSFSCDTTCCFVVCGVSYAT